MFTSFSSIHWTGVFLAFLGYFILGALWFTLLFKRPYKISLGKEHEPDQKPAPIFIVGPALCSLVITITTALLMNSLGINTVAGAIEFALIAGIGYLVANTINIAINPNIPRPILYGIISGAFHLTGMVIVCSILVAMK